MARDVLQLWRAELPSPACSAGAQRDALSMMGLEGDLWASAQDCRWVTELSHSKGWTDVQEGKGMDK